MDNEYDLDMENNDDLKENEGLDMEPDHDDLFYKESLIPNEPRQITSPATQGEAEYYIKITGFSLGLKPKKNSRTCIVVREDDDDDSPGVVGILKEGQTENIQVDILITGSQIFSLEGTNPSKVHIVGHYIPADQYSIDDLPFGVDDDLNEEELEQLMQMQGARKRRRGEDLEMENVDQDEDLEGDGPQITEVPEEEDEVQEPPAKKQKTNNGKAQPTQKKPNNKNKNKNKNKKNKNKNNNQNEDNNNNNDDNEDNNNNKKNKKKNKKNKKKKSPKQSPQQTPKSPQNKQKKKKEFVNAGQGLRYKQLREGNGKPAKKNSTVKVYYVGQLEDKTIFDKCLSGEGFKFKLGGGQVIKGWERGVEGMKVGEKRRLVIPPHLAYGKEGSSPEIPPNATLTFTIEVKSIN